MIYIAPDMTLRILNSHPEYVGIQFHKAFRTIFKFPKWVDYDLHYRMHNNAPLVDPG